MDSKEWDKLLTKISKQLYEGQQKPGSISPEMVSTIAKELMGGINIGYGKGFADEGLTNTQFETLVTLEKNVFHFSGAKNWNQLREMSALLLDGNGKLKSFEKFLADVRMVDATYNAVYLRAEYENAITSAQMIDKWQQFEAEKDVFPNLRWRTELSERTCPLCEALNGLTLPFNHPWWKQNGIPRHFKCHCDYEQVEEGADITDLNKLDIPETHPMFRSNPGISGVAFSPKHPYFKSIPSKERKKIFIATEQLIPKKD